MASVFKVTTTKTDPQTGRKRRIRSRCWHVRYKDAAGIVRQQKGYTDRMATKALATDLERRAARQDVGLIDPHEEHRRRPLTDHLTEFIGHLDAKDDTADYTAKVKFRLLAIFAGCGFERISDLDRDRVERYLSERRRTDDRFGIATSNHYTRAVKNFCNWLVESRRTDASPMQGLKQIDKQTDVRRVRVVLDDDQLSHLIATTRRSDRVFRGLTGEDRSMLYTLAIYTALRAKELASVTPASFAFDIDPATLTIAAAYTKSKKHREDILVLHRDAVDQLQGWTAKRLRNERLWPGTWYMGAAGMLAKDLADAGIDREDAEGRVVDFHSLRSVAITRGARAGLHPKELQQFARHSTINLTLNTYTRFGLVDLAGAIDKVPSLPTTAKDEPQTMAATGTDGVGEVSQEFAPMFAHDGDFPWQSLASDGETSTDDGAIRPDHKSLKKQPLGSDCQGMSRDGEKVGDWARTSVSGTASPRAS